LLTVSRSFMNVANRVLWRMMIILKANKVKLFESSVLFVFWYHSLNVLDTPRICNISRLRVKCIITNTMHCLFLVYWIKIPLHVSGIYSSSSGGKVYLCGNWYFYDDCQRVWVEVHPGSLTVIIEVPFTTYDKPYLLMMGCWCLKHVEVS
jgi:hypothetical protein